MKYLRVNTRTIFAALCGIVLVGGVGVFRVQADSWDKKTVLTINEPIQVRDRLLEPGTYVFKLMNSNADRHIVQIFNQDQSHIVDTILAIPNYRLEPTGDSRFRFWETPPGQAKALRAWFYPGDNFGQEFTYPKHPAILETAVAMNTTPARSYAPAEPVPPAPQPQPTVRETPAPAPAAEPAPAQQEPMEIARAAPPAPAAAPEPAPTPQATPAAPAETLPKTASSYPVIGLAGLACLGLFGLIRDSGAKRRPNA